MAKGLIGTGRSSSGYRCEALSCSLLKTGRRPEHLGKWYKPTSFIDSGLGPEGIQYNSSVRTYTAYGYTNMVSSLIQS